MRRWNALFAALVALWVFAPFSLLARRQRPPGRSPTVPGSSRSDRRGRTALPRARRRLLAGSAPGEPRERRVSGNRFAKNKTARQKGLRPC